MVQSLALHRRCMYPSVYRNDLLVLSKQKEMVSYGFIILAAFFNACMDATETDVKFNQSIFSHLNKKFWLKSVSWQYAMKIGGWKADFWHICKSLMIICFAFSIAFMDLSHQWWVKFITVGVLWNIVFVVVYHKLLKVK